MEISPDGPKIISKALNNLYLITITFYLITLSVPLEV